jgi:hypothetical protein
LCRPHRTRQPVRRLRYPRQCLRQHKYVLLFLPTQFLKIVDEGRDTICVRGHHQDSCRLGLLWYGLGTIVDQILKEIEKRDLEQVHEISQCRRRNLCFSQFVLFVNAR